MIDSRQESPTFSAGLIPHVCICLGNRKATGLLNCHGQWRQLLIEPTFYLVAVQAPAAMLLVSVPTRCSYSK